MSGWHLKKEVTIGQLVSMGMILISGLWWASSVETRFVDAFSKIEIKESERKAEDARIEEKTEILFNNMGERFDRYQSDVSKALAKIDSSINRLSDKIDKKADK